MSATRRRYPEFGLDRVALGQDWLAAASLALTQPLAASTPFAEKGYLRPNGRRPWATGSSWRAAVDLPSTSHETSQPGRLFIDLFELREGQEPRRVGGADPGATRFDYDAMDGPACVAAAA